MATPIGSLMLAIRSIESQIDFNEAALKNESLGKEESACLVAKISELIMALDDLGRVYEHERVNFDGMIPASEFIRKKVPHDLATEAQQDKRPHRTGI